MPIMLLVDPLQEQKFVSTLAVLEETQPFAGRT
jgi:hypothetical protein